MESNEWIESNQARIVVLYIPMAALSVESGKKWLAEEVIKHLLLRVPDFIQEGNDKKSIIWIFSLYNWLIF